MTRVKRCSTRGFAVTEFLLVVSLAAAAALMAIPKLGEAEAEYRARICGTNLIAIENAVDQWAIDHRKEPGAKVKVSVLLSEQPELRPSLRCPGHGTYQAVLIYGEHPRCSLGDAGDAKPENDHVYLDE